VPKVTTFFYFQMNWLYWQHKYNTMAVNERDLKNFVDGLLIGSLFGAIVATILILTLT
jgi:hypothetical protein